MTNQFMRYARAFVLPVLALGASSMFSSCGSKQDDPTPIDPTPQKYTRVDVNVGMNMIIDPSNSFFKGSAILNADNTISYGLNSAINGVDASRVATGASAGDNTKFSMVINVENITPGSSSVEGGMFYVSSKKADKEIITYRPATSEGSLKEVVEIDAVKKIETHKHVTEIKLFAPEAKSGGVRFATFASKQAFHDFIQNSSENTGIFTQMNVMDVKPTTSTSFYSINPN